MTDTRGKHAKMGRLVRVGAGWGWGPGLAAALCAVLGGAVHSCTGMRIASAAG